MVLRKGIMTTLRVFLILALIVPAWIVLAIPAGAAAVDFVIDCNTAAGNQAAPPVLSTKQIDQDASFTFEVYAEAGALDVDGLDLFLNFDNTKLRLTTIVPDDTIVGYTVSNLSTDNNGPTAGGNSIEEAAGLVLANAAGMADISMAYTLQIPTGSFRVCTMTFTGLAGTNPTTTFVYNTAVPRQNKVASGGNNILHETFSANITVIPGIAFEFYSAYPSAPGTPLTSPITAGTAQNLTIRVTEAAATKTNYVGTVAFTSATDAQAVLPANYTFTALDAGVHTFANGLTFKTSGARTLTATDVGTPAITTTSAAITVNAAAANKLAFSIQPASVGTVDAVFGTQPVVQIRDQYNNVVTTAIDTVVLTDVLAADDTTTGTGALSGTTSLAAVAGVATFTNIGYNKLDTIHIRATSGALTPAVSTTNIALTVGAPAKLMYGTAPAAAVPAGNVWTAFTLNIFDQYDNLTASTANVLVTPSAGAFATGTTTKAAVGGVATFNDLTYNTQATITVTATSGALTPAVSGNVVIGPAAAAKLAVGTAPATPVTAGATWTAFTINILDAFNNATTSTANVTIAPSAGTFAAGTLTKAAVNGTATFNDIKYNTVGTITITATSAGLTPVTSGNVVVSPAAAATLQVTGITDPITKNVASNVTVTAKDAFGNTATTYVGTIHFTSTDTAATLPANYLFVGGDNGVKVFAGGIVMQTYGDQSVTATDTVTATITGSQTLITVIPVVLDTYALATGWNIFSTPISLEDGYRSMGEVVAVSAATLGGKISIAYYYDPTSTTTPWKAVTSTYDLNPCDAIYIKMTGADVVSIVADTMPAIPSKRLYAGWNLVSLGYYNVNFAGSTKAVDQTLTSIFTVTGDLVGYAQVVSPALNQTGFTYLRGNPGGGAIPNMVAGDGYWVFMVNPGTIGGFTPTPLP